MKTTIALFVCALALACAKDKDQIPSAPAPVPVAEPEIKGRRVDIKVSNAGYSPESVEVKANEEVTLVFTMVEKSECGEEIAIPSMNLLKKLELGKPLAIPFRVSDPGEVKFACGMNMMRGKIVVVQN